MRTIFTKQVIATIFVVVALGGSVLVFCLLRDDSDKLASTELVELNNFLPKHNVIGLSVGGRKIESYTYGSGKTHLAFVGGIHGGYEWNSVLLAYKFIDYLDANPEVIPANLTITVIPSANPDGAYKAIGKEEGRFNANGVDLNRNFDCKWKPESMWKGNQVSGGTVPFSEPETVAIRNFVLENKPDAVIFWHSQSNAVYASECEAGILPETLDIMNAYSKASGYPAIKSFDSYEVTGDAEGWLASINIPAITVELQTHETVEWKRNLAGIKAIFEYYGRTE
ncbi:succinylglutamate desuccinylase/aspartoacylase family protein [Patescibacteria group bacterium]|nr:succinylglutamate desuccinylase/aspartoacylase family protein [Patescibacteria group bacterium]